MKSDKLVVTSERFSFDCPCCNQELAYANIKGLSLQDFINSFEGATLDCSYCAGLLIINQQTVYPFHEWLHAKNPEWPADGKDTDFITLPQSPPSS